MTARYFDVIVVTDARLVGGGNKSLAQEILAHSRAGYTTGLVSLTGPARGGGRPIDTSLMRLLERGLLTMIRSDEKVDAGVVIARGPSMFEVEQTVVPRIRALHWILVANAFNTDPQVSNMLYDPLRTERRAAELFGHRWTWAPLSTVVRRRMLAAHPKLELSSSTWSNIIKTDEWWIQRQPELTRPIRLGRHSRDAPGKWPTDRQSILDAYPDDGDFVTSIMGGATVPTKVLGYLPSTWRVESFGSRDPRMFLRDVDVYPYFHHPSMKEAFGRSVLEAIASGAIAVLQPYLEEVFSGAALYAEPHQVQDIARSLAEDPRALSEQRARARDVVEATFSYDSHVERIRSLIGKPRVRTNVARPVSRGILSDVSEGAGAGRRALFYTDNGHGLGHVTRLMAYAKRLPRDVSSLFLTMSKAYSLVDEQGFPVEYFPSAKSMGFGPDERAQWEQLLDVRFRRTLQRFEPAVVVIDHVNPPAVLRQIVQDHPNTRFVWSRRGLWRQQRKPAGLSMADAFHHIIEPMDLSAAVDMGFTPRLSENVRYVPPVTLVERPELLTRHEAQKELGLPADRPTILLNLSADTTEELSDLIRRVRLLLDKFTAAADRPAIFAPRHALHGDGLSGIDDVVMKPVYPVAKFANAFDGAISTAGYNSYHELVYLRVPTIFLARETETLDDQTRRARFADLGGFGVSAGSVDGLDFEIAVQQLMDPVRRARMRAAAAEVFPVNGAHAAAAYLDELLRGRSSDASPRKAEETGRGTGARLS